MSSKEELIDFLGQQISIENDIVDLVNKSLGDIDNQAIKGVLWGISLDSLKHADMYGAALKLITSTSKVLSEENLDKQKMIVERHLKIEAEIIAKIQKILPRIENEKIKLLLNAIFEDEKRHHSLLKRVLEILVKGETITDNEWFDFIWSSVPTHGSPGG